MLKDQSEGDSMAYEKMDEKEVEKQEEKWQRHPVGAVIGAAFLIWIGVVLLASNLGFMSVFTDLLDRLSIRPYELPFDVPFFSVRMLQVFFLGAGVLMLFEIVIRLLLPSYRRQMGGPFIGAVAFFALGLGHWSIVGPLVLIAVGVSILLGGFHRRR
jgi:hypothetical protein